jgi:hypothetical protein
MTAVPDDDPPALKRARSDLAQTEGDLAAAHKRLRALTDVLDVQQRKLGEASHPLGKWLAVWLVPPLVHLCLEYTPGGWCPTHAALYLGTQCGDCLFQVGDATQWITRGVVPFMQGCCSAWAFSPLSVRCRSSRYGCRPGA